MLCRAGRTLSRCSAGAHFDAMQQSIEGHDWGLDRNRLSNQLDSILLLAIGGGAGYEFAM